MSDQTTTPEEQPQAPGLSIQDLMLMVTTIQVTAQRGAFKAEELSSIGGLYERLVGFLKANGAIKDAEPAETPTANTTEK